MHNEVRFICQEVKKKYPDYFIGADVLDVGSLDINGNNRYLFTNCNIVGIDLEKGRNVDVVTEVHKYISSKKFDVIVCTEMLEHDYYWQESLKRMLELLRKGGLLLLTAAGPNRPEHGTTKAEPQFSPFTNNHYRNVSVEDLQECLPSDKLQKWHIGYRRDKHDIYFYGIKK
ncbi:hypothetical protein LCGC14_1791930 [marine sediment metagenome]|uniref:Methyltransferase type 11 domain-containing protein n=1 Tax=marine sediment metagenome TaxID=412755 RepID=A0A0F9J725_9ZZZZ